jgi:hypothetical protein
VHEHQRVDETLRFARCGACGKAFYACAECDRFGERRYCSAECQVRGQDEVRREARRRESRTEEGRLNNGDRQRRFRERHPGRRGQKCRQSRGRASFAQRTDEQVVTDPPSCEPGNSDVVRARGPALACGYQKLVAAKSLNIRAGQGMSGGQAILKGLALCRSTGRVSARNTSRDRPYDRQS